MWCYNVVQLSVEMWWRYRWRFEDGTPARKTARDSRSVVYVAEGRELYGRTATTLHCHIATFNTATLPHHHSAKPLHRHSAAMQHSKNIAVQHARLPHYSSNTATPLHWNTATLQECSMQENEHRNGNTATPLHWNTATLQHYKSATRVTLMLATE